MTSARVAVIGRGSGRASRAERPARRRICGRGGHDRAAPDAWGLVRLGVAPDHLEHQARSRGRSRRSPRSPGSGFSAIVELGRDVTHEELTAAHHDAVDLRGRRAHTAGIGIPGRGPPRLVGRHRVRRLVQRPPPTTRPIPFDLNTERGGRRRRRNVALGVARMLALAPEELAPTDATDAGDRAATSTTRPLRGDRAARAARPSPFQAAFDHPGAEGDGRELADADAIVDPGRPRGRGRDGHELAAQPRGAARVTRRARPAGGRRVGRLPRPCVSPVEIRGAGPRRGDRGRPQRGSSPTSVAACAAVPTDAPRDAIACRLVFRSVGYRGEAPRPGVPFDEAKLRGPARPASRSA